MKPTSLQKGIPTDVFRDLRSYLARVHEAVITSRRRMFLAACVALLVVAACKYGMVGIMLYGGMSRTHLRLQDSLTAGLLAALVVWLALVAAHIRQKQLRDQVQTVADLNHHLRNALYVILNSQYLNAHEQKDAVLSSVDRIDRALQRILPPEKGTPVPELKPPAPARLKAESQDEAAGD